MQTGSNNLNYPSGNITIQMVNEAIYKRGLVMTNPNSNVGIPISVAAANDKEISIIQNRIAAGDLTASAPSEGMFESWSIEEKAGLQHALSEIFNWKK